MHFIFISIDKNKLNKSFQNSTRYAFCSLKYCYVDMEVVDVVLNNCISRKITF